MADSPSNSSSPEREMKKKRRHDVGLGLRHAAVGAISKPNQEEADLDVDIDDDGPDIEKARSLESLTGKDDHQHSADHEDVDSGADDDEEAEPDSDEEEAAESENCKPNQEPDSVASDDCNHDIISWFLAYKKKREEEADSEGAVADADEEEADSEGSVADADEEETDSDESVADADEEEADSDEAVADAVGKEADSGGAIAAEPKNPSEEKAKPEEEKDYVLPEELTPQLDEYMKELSLHHGFKVDSVQALPEWLQQKLIHPINFNHPLHKPIVEGICAAVCVLTNKKQKQEMEFVRVLDANREGELEYWYYITFEARDRLDNGTIKTYQTRTFVWFVSSRALDNRTRFRVKVESLDCVPPTPKPTSADE